MKRIKQFIILTLKKKLKIASPSSWANGTLYPYEYKTYRDLWRLAKD